MGGLTREMLTDRDPAFCIGSTSDGRAILLREGVSRRAAAAKVGISHQTFYNWLQADPGFLAAVGDATIAAVSARHALKSA